MAANPNVTGKIDALQTDEQRRSYPYTNAFRSWVMEELTRRKTTYPTPTTAPFVRMTSMAADPNQNYNFFSIGLHGFTGGDADIFELSYGSTKEIVGYGYDTTRARDDRGRLPKRLIAADEITIPPLTSAEQAALRADIAAAATDERNNNEAVSRTKFANGAHPIPGITDLKINRIGIQTSIQATVEWKCYNRAQLEFLRQHFMCTANSIVVEWGNNFSDKQLNKMLEFGNEKVVLDNLSRAMIEGRGYIIDQWVKPNQGNYDFLVGWISNYQVGIDARTGIYTVTTQIVAQAENWFGISNTQTFVQIASGSASANKSTFKTATTIVDFFKIGGRFDVIVNENRAVPSMVADQVSNWSSTIKGTNETVLDLEKNFSTNPQDYTFISWEFFSKIIVSTLFSLITNDPKVKAGVFDFVKLFEELPVVDTNLPASSRDKELWAGDNLFLRSCDPDTMLIIKKSMGSAPDGLKGAGFFDNDPAGGGWRGKLSKGVWLNAGMVRQKFLGATSFADAINAILDAMNAATAGYWNLHVYYNEENNTMQVVDGNHLDNKIPPLYKFNVGATGAAAGGNGGECLNIEFDSAFPPEMVAQMALYAKIKADPEAFADLLADLPTVGTTSRFMFGVSANGLTDLLDLAVRSKRKAATIETDKLGSYNVGTGPEQVDNSRESIRMVPMDNMLMMPAGGLIDSLSPVQGQTLGDVLITTKGNVPDKINLPTSGVHYNTAPSSLSPDVKSRNRSRQSPPMNPVFNTRVDNMISAYASKGITMNLLETYRSQDRQDYLYSFGHATNARRPGSKFTAQPGRLKTTAQLSHHTEGKAADFQLLNANGHDVTQQMYDNGTSDQIARDSGLFMVHNFNDPGHVQLTLAPPMAVLPSATIASGSNAFTVTDFNGNELTQEEVQDLAKKTVGYATRFGSPIVSVIDLQPSTMVNRIASDGYSSFGGQSVNSFVAPFPTTTAIAVDVLGISGMSTGDGFYVDKLPFIFDRYGCFRIIELQETVSNQGWITKVKGYFQLVYLDGKGGPHLPIHSLQKSQE